MTRHIARFIHEDLHRIYPLVKIKLTNLLQKNILITGGAGFLGSWLCEWLIFLNREEHANIKIYIADRDSDFFLKRFTHEIADGQIQLINGDIRSLSEIPKEVNYIIHAAGTPDTRHHVSCPIDTMSSIAEGTSAVLRAASRVSELYKFLNISTSTLYSINEATPLVESRPFIPYSDNPKSVYAEAKRYAEKLCHAARSEARLPIVTVRPFTFCGPYHELNSPWVLNNFINDAIHSRPIKIFGTGDTVRAVMYGADFAVWVLIILLHGESGQVFNVGSSHYESVLSLANRVAGCFNPMPIIQTNTALAKITERPFLVPNVEFAKNKLNLELYTDIELAITRTVQWYKEEYQ